MMASVRTFSGLDRAVHVFALVSLHLDLHGRVVDLETPVEFLTNRSQNLLTLTNALFSNQNVTAAGDNTGANRPDVQIVDIQDAADVPNRGNDIRHS